MDLGRQRLTLGATQREWAVFCHSVIQSHGAPSLVLPTALMRLPWQLVQFHQEVDLPKDHQNHERLSLILPRVLMTVPWELVQFDRGVGLLKDPTGTPLGPPGSRRVHLQVGQSDGLRVLGQRQGGLHEG